MRPLSAFLAAFLLALVLTGVTAARTHSFQSANCNTAAPQPTPNMTRDGQMNYAIVAAWDGYQWGGGCWNNNDVDDSPGEIQPPHPRDHRPPPVRRSLGRLRRRSRIPSLRRFRPLGGRRPADPLARGRGRLSRGNAPDERLGQRRTSGRRRRCQARPTRASLPDAGLVGRARQSAAAR